LSCHKQKKDFYSLSITEILHEECAEKKYFLRTKTVKKEMVIPPGITMLLGEELPEEWNSTGNYRLLN
jgi:hypothetical protein